MATTPESLPRLRLRVSAAAEASLRRGHPWLFAESIREQNRPGAAGELAVVYDRRDRFLAVGLFDPESPIRLRVLAAGKPRNLDADWWQERLERACALRRSLFDEKTTGFRWLHGESDGWPGLVLDRYADTLVVKLYTVAWLPRLADLLDLFRETLRPARVVLRLSRNVQPAALEKFNRTDGQVLAGPPVEGPVLFRESGLVFEAEVIRGQKTGFFLDQRENRRRVESLACGRRVLNAFSFSGGFSLYAARGGAVAVTDLDISAHALESARRNFALNRSHPSVAACAHRSVQADAFEWLNQIHSPPFDLVILDPPSLARREVERAGALRAYERLTLLGIGALAPGGILVACSCSAHVSAGEFFQTVRRAAAKTGRSCLELATTTHPPDHPATFPEAHYLKAMFLQFDCPSVPGVCPPLKVG
jgi:23S rRNA (cytosine1962-C5)-methyltransferase